MEKSRRTLLKSAGALVAAFVLAVFLGKETKARGDEGSEFQPQPVAYPPLFISHQVLKVPLEPDAPEWTQETAPIRIPLAPQMIVKPRLYEPSVTEILVRSLYDDDTVGFLLEWQEKTGTQNIGIGRTTQFRDAVAFSFPADTTKPLPYFGMGHLSSEVVIYQWKSDWEFGPDYDVENEFKGAHADFYPFSGRSPGQMAKGSDYGSADKAEWAANPRDKAFNTAWAAQNILADPQAKKRASVEKLVASGFGNLTTDSRQDCLARAKWQPGWKVVIIFPRKQDRFTFRQRRTYPVNFAVWDGHNQERGAEKSISTWSSFALEQKVGWPSFAAAIVVTAATAGIAWLILRRRRLSTQPGEEKE